MILVSPGANVFQYLLNECRIDVYPVQKWQLRFLIVELADLY